jgi:hypothetical protein
VFRDTETSFLKKSWQANARRQRVSGSTKESTKFVNPFERRPARTRLRIVMICVFARVAKTCDAHAESKVAGFALTAYHLST